jgi:hypothetical protein
MSDGTALIEETASSVQRLAILQTIAFGDPHPRKG